MAESLLPPRSPTDLFGDPIDAKPPWFNSSAFLGEDFDPDSYVADLRTFVPLESLAAELRSYLADLKAELIDLINRDYADFIGLSTRLVDVDSAAARMRAPLVEFRDKVATFRAVIDAALTSIRSGLRQRTEASAAREILELLLDTFHVVSKVEKLIKELPSSHFGPSNTEIVPAEKVSSANANGALNTEVGPNHREDQSILLERIAIQDLPFIENMEKRIQNVTLMLDGSLGNCFVDGLKHQDAKSIYNCLRAYAAIDNTSAAEELFRTVIVSPMIQKIIPHDNLQVVSGASLDELEDDYQQIMQGVKKDCKFLLDISSTANSGFHVFSFLANSIIREVLIAIQKGKPGAFSPGRPAGFLKNYKSSLGFLAFLEEYIGE
ncbi:hypothetical protein ZIOFF_054736 [Zingiber officinale]|uniref:Conserved oligomeric Golgi complex subunit 2 n=1 Tax=Zingiber officinale TaxID=94328 RepID=A0A8J5FEG2_ZINOF|nr:hypothetical protein ZIOFF_054736 [Zingiber officinale]